MQEDSESHTKTKHNEKQKNKSGNKLIHKTKTNLNNQTEMESEEKSYSSLISEFKIKNNNNINNNKPNFPKEVKHSSFLPNFRNFRFSEVNGKTVEERKVFQRTEFRPKTISFNDESAKKVLGIRAIPQTSIERIVKIMNKAKLRLIANNNHEDEIVDEVDWAIKEILSDNLYKIEVHEKFSKEEKEFYKEYSNYNSDVVLAREISKYGIFRFLILLLYCYLC